MCPKNFIPSDKERLREIVFCAVELMVDIMIRAIVIEENMQQVSGKPQTAMVINSLNGGEGKEEYGSARCHPCNEKGKDSPNCVKDKPFEWMIVESSKGIGDDKSVVLRVDVFVQKLVDVHQSVHEVLPSVHHHHAHDELEDDHWKRRLRQDNAAVSSAHEREEEGGDGNLESLLQEDALHNGSLGNNVFLFLFSLCVKPVFV